MNLEIEFKLIVKLITYILKIYNLKFIFIILFYNIVKKSYILDYYIYFSIYKNIIKYQKIIKIIIFWFITFAIYVFYFNKEFLRFINNKYY